MNTTGVATRTSARADAGPAARDDIGLKESRHRLVGKVAVVTGSTSGIGESVARLFAHEGAHVVITGRNLDRGRAVAEKIRAAGGDVVFVPADITIEQDVIGLIEQALAAYGRIDILVNNAGKMIAKPLAETTLEDFDSFVDLDARSYFQVMKLVIPLMERQGGGAVLNVTSLSAINPMPVHAVYGFAKAGITQMTRCIAQEYAHRGVRVNSLLSGLVRTPMVADDPNFDAVESTVPMGRASEPIEQAYAALFLVSDEASYMTGSSVVVAGGI